MEAIKYKLTISLILLTTFSGLLPAQTMGVSGHSLQYPKELVELAGKLGMEPVSGDVFTRNLQIYGGKGAPFVFDVITEMDPVTGYVPKSVLFWCRKGNTEYLVLAKDNIKADSELVYEIESVISEYDLIGSEYDIEGSYGLIAYDGVFGIDKDLSNFVYLSDRDKKGPEGIYPNLNNGFWPVMIYQESSVQVLYYYEGEWFEYIESDI